MQIVKCFLQNALAEGASEQDEGAERAVGLIFDEEAGGIPEYQPEEDDRERRIQQQPYLDERVDQIGAQERVHTRQHALMQAVIPKNMHRDMLEKPQSEDAEQHKSNHTRANQYRDIAVVEIRHNGRERSVLIRELETVIKDTGAVLVDIALADAEDRILQEHL